jgi:hypothetical protein
MKKKWRKNGLGTHLLVPTMVMNKFPWKHVLILSHVMIIIRISLYILDESFDVNAFYGESYDIWVS